MNTRGLLKLSVAVAALFAACDFRPLDHDLADMQYRFAAENLDAYFIYRDSMPPDLYAFPTPQELYLSVHDQYTEFYGSEEAKALMSQLSTTQGGIGIWMDSVANGYLIKAVFAGSPGEKAGLKALDTIVRVGDTPVAAMDVLALQSLLQGDIGIDVVLRVKRGGNYLNITVTRGIFTFPSVFTDTIDSAIAMIRIEGFYQSTSAPGGTAQEFAEALETTAWADQTIIDLRSNGGGYIDQCLIIIGELVKEGTQIIIYRQRGIDEATGRSAEYVDTIFAAGPGGARNRELYILVDERTASASEIMVSCLMQREDVTVIGDTTYGKGCGQILCEDGPGGVLAKITCMTLHPVGDDPVEYNQIGIAPDVLIDSVDAYDVALGMIGERAPAKRRAGGAPRRGGVCDARIGVKEPWGLLREGRR
ncbi:MAG: PDZ domain-containing protein [Chitinispirillaceae bacterium]|nr:PDZ domain-containing protein [Chitinispirillaceae bacterium]